MQKKSFRALPEKPEKPSEPQEDRLSTSFFVVCFVCFIILSSIFVFLWSRYKEKQLYQNAVASYNQTIAGRESELKQYLDVTYRLIKSIDPNYKVSATGDIFYDVTVKCEKDQKSQYIGSEMSYYFDVNGNQVSQHKDSSINLCMAANTVITTKIIEDDPASDDVGYEVDSFPLGFIALNDGVELQHTVRVSESFGLDAGHVAIYHITYSIKPKQLLRLTQTQRKQFPQYPVLPEKPLETDFRIGFFEAIMEYSVVDIAIAVIFALFIVRIIVSVCRVKANNQRARTEYNGKMKNYNHLMEVYKTERETFIRHISGKSIRKLAGVPDNVFFTDDLLPYTKGDNRLYGDFTVYVTIYGKCYHKKKGCCGAYGQENLIKILRDHHMFHCSRCYTGDSDQIPSWYEAYLDYRKRIDFYEITEHQE